MRYKLQIILAIFLISAFIVGYANSPEDKDKLKKLTDDYVEAFNLHDVDKLISFWSSDGALVNLNTHEIIQSRNNLIKYYKDLFEKEKALNLKITINNLSSLESGIANERGLAQISYSDKTVDNDAFKAEFIKADGTWQLKTLSKFTIQPSNSNFEKLKDLAWLIGNWVDQDEDVMINLTYKWDNNKSYIFQNYDMKVLDQKYLTGHQVIGWDPIKKSIRSWIYDFDGGFGESFWTQEGEKWYANTVYTFYNGRKGSALHIYTKVDDNTYTFASVSRDIDGIIQPNIGPFTVVRKGENK